MKLMSVFAAAALTLVACGGDGADESGADADGTTATPTCASVAPLDAMKQLLNAPDLSSTSTYEGSKLFAADCKFATPADFDYLLEVIVYQPGTHWNPEDAAGGCDLAITTSVADQTYEIDCGDIVEVAYTAEGYGVRVRLVRPDLPADVAIAKHVYDAIAGG